MFTLRPSLSVRLATHPNERAELVALRTRVYRQVGKHLTPGTMTDAFDEHAILVGVWRGRTPIATVRVVWQAPDAEWEHDRFTPWTSAFPSRQNSVEVSRFCIDRRERNWRTMRALCHGLLEAVCRTGRTSVVACCTAELIEFYKVFFGAAFLNVRIQHCDLGPKPHYLFRCDFTQALLGHRLAFLPWAALWPLQSLRALRNYPDVICRPNFKQSVLQWLGVALEPLLALGYHQVRPLARRIRGRGRRVGRALESSRFDFGEPNLGGLESKIG